MANPTNNITGKLLLEANDKIYKLEGDIKEKQGLLSSAVFEIQRLRTQNQIQAARLTMFDDLKTLLYTRPGSEMSGQGMSPDLVFEIQQNLNK